MRPYKEHILKACERLKDVPFRMIAPSHGPVLRKDPRTTWRTTRARVGVEAGHREEGGDRVRFRLREHGAMREGGGRVAAGAHAGAVNGVEVPMERIIDQIDESVGLLIGPRR